MWKQKVWKNIIRFLFQLLKSINLVLWQFRIKYFGVESISPFVSQLAKLSIDGLRAMRGRLAHLVLGYITMAYVWGRGDEDIRKV